MKLLKSALESPEHAFNSGIRSATNQQAGTMLRK
jgi:hypothetical protein